MKKLLTLLLLLLPFLAGCLEQRYQRIGKKVSGEWEILRYHNFSTTNGVPSGPETDWRNAGRLSLTLCESLMSGGCSAQYLSPEGEVSEGSYQPSPARSRDLEDELSMYISTDSVFNLRSSFMYVLEGDTLFLRQEARSASGSTQYVNTTELELLRIE